MKDIYYGDFVTFWIKGLKSTDNGILKVYNFRVIPKVI